MSTQNDRGVDMRWMPKDCDGQIKMGFNIIANAFKAKVKTLEEDLRSSNECRSELEDKVTCLTSKLQKLERENLEASLLQSRVSEMEEKFIEKVAHLENEIVEHVKREQIMITDNRRLSEHFRSLKKKASQLEAFRKLVVETIRKDDEPCSFVDDTAENRISLLTDTTVGRPSASSHSENMPSYGQSIDLSKSANACQMTNLHSNSSSAVDSSFDFRRVVQLARSQLTGSEFHRFSLLTKRLADRSLTLQEALEEVIRICGYENRNLIDEFKTACSCRADGAPQTFPLYNRVDPTGGFNNP